jgi:hypothetical protein
MSTDKVLPCPGDPVMHGIIRVFVPVMDDEPLCRFSVNPPRGNEGFNQLRFVFAVVDRERDVLIGQLADVTSWRLPGRQVPDGFQQPYTLPEGNVEAPA